MLRHENVIIGGGVIGLSIAYNMANIEAGDYVVYEKSHVGWGASFRSAALIRTHYTDELSVRIAVESLKYFQKYHEDTGFQNSGFFVGVGKKDQDTLKKVTAMMRELGANVKLMDPSKLMEIDKEINCSQYSLVAYEPESGYADPMKTVNHFKKGALDRGVEIKEHSEVKRILVEKNKIKAIVVNNDRIECDNLIIAAGPWSVELASQVGEELPIRPRRSPVLLIQGPKDFGYSHPAFYDIINGVYGRPYMNDVILSGPGLLAGAASASETLKNIVSLMMKPRLGYKLEPDSFNSGLYEEEIDFIYSRVTNTFPKLKEGYPKFGWAGIIDDCADGYEILGASPKIEGLYYAVGFSGHGFKESPAIGKLIAESVLKGKAFLDISKYNLKRFLEGNPIKPKYEYRGE